MGMYLCTKFEVSSIILTGFIQEVIVSPPPQNEALKSSLRLGLKKVLEDQKKITDRLVYFQLSLKYLRNYCQNKNYIYGEIPL